ncbi:MAG: hypothetical protein HOV81_45725 [Kofleriaceae bacterium]|nr:hypothetical protein [Kofleriaceae bacterium]
MRLAVLLCLAACGRIDFDETLPGSDGGSGDGSMVTPTGPKGPRWIKKFGAGSKSQAAGVRGEVAVVGSFNNGSFAADDNVALVGQGFISTAFVRYSATGDVMQTAVFDATGFCDMRGITLDGDDVVVAGYTAGTASMPALGACSMVTNRQDPVVLRLAPDGTQSLVGHWVAGTANAQAWNVGRLADGSFVLSGIYGGTLAMGAGVPMASIDPSGWVGRTSPSSATGGVTWAEGLRGETEVHGGPISTAGAVTCTMGAFSGTVTILGAQLQSVGGYDAWVARVDETGAAQYVRGIGSVAGESYFDSGSIAARDDSCTIGVVAPADVTLDAVTYPMSDGAGILVQYRNDGSVKWARRLPAEPFAAYVGDRLFVAVEVTGTLSIGGTPYTAQGKDAVVLELDDTGAIIGMAGVVGGAGDQAPSELVAIGPDALAITVTTRGVLSFGDTSFDTVTTTARAVASLGI